MIRILITLLGALVLLLPDGAGAAERKLSVFGFDSVRINGGVNVDIATGKGPSATASADSQRILDRLQLRKSGNELVISVRSESENADSFSQDDPIDLKLTTYALKKITHLGPGSVSIDELKGRVTSARLGGFGNVAIGGIDGDMVEIAMNGGGAIKLSGEVREARLSLLGASSFDGNALTVDKLKLTQRGPASTEIAVNREAEINNTGSGLIRVIGKPNCQVRSAGAAEIICDPKT